MQDWLITTEEKIVVAFDICSSTTIIEDLSLTNNVARFLDLLDDVGQLLFEKKSDLKFEVYKFVGDGWILLFPSDTSGQQLIRFLHLLALTFENRFREHLGSILEVSPRIRGLTFGVDVGTIHRAPLFAKNEYIGRALVVACRLQAAVKEHVEVPSNKVLVSRPFFQRYLASVPDIQRHHPAETVRRLRNIRNGEDFHCVMLSLPGEDTLAPPAGNS